MNANTLTRQYALLDAARWQDAQLERLRARLNPLAEAEEHTWFATSRGYGHGSRQGTVISAKPHLTPRSVEDDLS